MNVPVVIRPIEDRDIDGWRSMRARLWPQADPGDLHAEVLAFVTSESAMIAAAFVADLDGAVCGFVEIAIRAFSDGCDSMPVPHIEGWCVEETLRGHGIGRALLDAAEAFARGAGFIEIASDAEVENLGSIAAHGACGYEEVERLVKFRKRLVDHAR